MIPVPVHAALDGVSAAALLLVPSAMGWNPALRGPIASAGAGVAAYSLATRYRPEAWAPLSMRKHFALDALQGAGFCLASALLVEEPPKVRAALGAYGLFSLAAVLLTDKPDPRRPRPPR